MTRGEAPTWLPPGYPLSSPAQPLRPSANTQGLALCLAWVGRMQGRQVPAFLLFPERPLRPYLCLPEAKLVLGLWDHHINTGLTDPFSKAFLVGSLGLVPCQPHPEVHRRWRAAGWVDSPPRQSQGYPGLAQVGTATLTPSLPAPVRGGARLWACCCEKPQPLYSPFHGCPGECGLEEHQ